MIQLVRAAEAHAEALRLRASDLRELAYLGEDRDPTEAVLDSLRMSDDSWAALTESGEVIAVFGLGLYDDLAAPWMLCSPLIHRHGRWALKFGPMWVARMVHLAQGRMLSNWIAKDNHSGRRFIRALGFKIMPSPNGDFDFFYFPHV